LEGVRESGRLFLFGAQFAPGGLSAIRLGVEFEPTNSVVKEANMAPLWVRMVVTLAAIVFWGSLSFMCLIRPKILQKRTLAASKTGILSFHGYVSSSAYIVQLRVMGVVFLLGSLFLAFVFLDLLTKL
jgi:hypothetical protein